MACRYPNKRGKEVRKLTESKYRKWMVIVAVATLAIAIIRLLTGQ